MDGQPPSKIGEIIGVDTEEDEYNNRLTSIFYGVPLAQSIFFYRFSYT
jgi:outer membrane protein